MTGRAHWQVRCTVAVAALAAGIVAWAALPVSGAGRGARPALIAAVCCAALSLAQLGGRIRAGRPAAQWLDSARAPAGVALWLRLWELCAAVPWPQLLIVALLVLEVLHPARPWHTVVLGLAILGWLLALHLAETDASPSVFRGQRPAIVAGAGLAGLAAAAGLLPAASAGSGWLSALAAVAALVVAGLALPV